MSWLELAKEVAESRNHAMHVNDMAEVINITNPELASSVKDIAGSISNAITLNIRSKKTKSVFKHVKNKSGGNKQGTYLLRRKAVKTHVVAEPILDVNNRYTGAAGEHAVLAELLFRGFNGSVMTVDEGIDIVAAKGGKYFHIQVKTSNESQAGNGSFLFTIHKKVFSKHNAGGTFYIFVIRRIVKKKWVNDYAIFPSGDIARFLNLDIIKDKPTLSFHVTSSGDGRYILGSREDISMSVNNFELIK